MKFVSPTIVCCILQNIGFVRIFTSFLLLGNKIASLLKSCWPSHLRSEFALLQTLLRLSHLVQFVVSKFFWNYILKDCVEIKER